MPRLRPGRVSPVIAADGHTYERAAIDQWLRTSKMSPMTGLELPHNNLVPNLALRALIQEWLHNNPGIKGT